MALFYSFFSLAQGVLECERALTQGTTLVTPNDKYLSLPLPFEPADQLRQKVQALSPDLKLHHRGEAHVTVLTPQENELLSTHLSRKELLEIANSTLKDDLHPHCVGMAEASIDGKKEKVFYVVVDSPSLFSVRKQLKAAFVAKGGAQNRFRPDAFHPHITLGFTLRDLHESDGVVKNKKTCVHPLSLQ